MRAPIVHLFLCGAAATSPLVAQSGAGEIKSTAISDLRPDWLSEAVVSPNGRFFILASYANESFLRYDRVTKQWAAPPGATLGRLLRWSPNGRFLTFVRQTESQDNYVWVLPLDTATALPNGTARRISTLPGIAPAFSPDSRRIAYASNDSGRTRIVVVPFNGGDEQVLFEGPGRGGAVDWSPDGKSVFAAYAQPGKSPRRLRVDVQTKQAAFFVVTGEPRVPLSPDGTRFANYDAASSRLFITSADGRTLRSVSVNARLRPFAWSMSSPNELLALEYVVPATVQRVSVAGGPIQSVTPVDSTPVGDAVRIAPDGRQFAFARTVRGSYGLHVASIDGGNVRRLGPASDIVNIAWSPSSRRIAYLTNSPSSSIRFVDPSNGVDRQMVAPPSGDATLGKALAWRRDELAIRYIFRPKGVTTTTREAREVGLDGKDRLLIRFEIPPTAAATFINDTLMVLRHRTGVQAVDLRTGASRELYKGPVHERDELGVSADGAWIAFITHENDKEIPRVLSLTTGETRSLPYTLGGEIGMLRFHPDGRSLVASACLTCVENSYVEKWEVIVIPMNGDPPRVLTASQPGYKDFGAPAVSPDGKTILFEAEQSYNTRLVDPDDTEAVVSSKQHVLIIDDDEAIRTSTAESLTRRDRDVRVADSATSALSRLDQWRPDVVLCDVRMPGMDGLALLAVLTERVPSADVIMMTAYDDMPTVVSAMRAGAVEFLVKPLDLHELRATVDRLFADRAERKAVIDETRPEPPSLDVLVGHDQRMIRTFKLIGQAASVRTTVLIRGESGTGKELVARAIHANAAHATSPFVPVNCAALPSTLLESELFGHVRGSFTGAVADRRGRFAVAGTGTIFLDEIGDTSLEFQTKLLRVLQDREYQPVGSEKTERTEARVIAATHRALETMITEGKFREDLYYRLRVIEIELPPLRERVGDIPLLAQQLAARACRAMQCDPVTISDDAMRILCAHTWPGNVRELENCLVGAIVLASSGVIRPDHLTLTGTPSGNDSPFHSLEDAERDHIARVFAATGRQKSRTAEILRVSRPRLDRLLKRHGLA